MRRSWLLWIAFLACLAVVAGAMGWISAAALRLDRAEAKARRQAELEENMRLALWRIDSALSPLLAQESVRPYIAYRTVQAAPMVSTPLAADNWSLVLVHFQFEPDGRLTSPNIPPKEMTSPILQCGNAEAQNVLARVAALTDRRRLSALLPPETAAGTRVVLAQAPSVPARPPMLASNSPRVSRGANEYQMRNQAIANNGALMVASQNEFNNMNMSVGNYSQLRNASGNSGLNFAGNAFAPSGSLASVTPHDNESNDAPSPAEMGGGLMTPLWINGQLILARRISVAGKDYLQGCLLDWPAVKSGLLESVSDLLPGADLVPVPPGGAEDQSAMLAALPARLVPGAIAAGGPAEPSPLNWILPVAWLCVLLAAAAVAALLAGVVRLGQRRADFVSAVTHELRTPLTTFHMYTEMLGEGMITDPAQQRTYIDTLRAEASRLSHLVENVLAYARLERRRINGIEPITVARLLECRERLAERCRQAGMTLSVDASDALLAAMVFTNSSIVEQILFNLVDNACKYAAGAEDKEIRLAVEDGGRGINLRLSDHGPGLPPAVARKLFRAFSKSGQEAANTAPGIGLGLALSKRLARSLGGRLTRDPAVEQGATFVLFLPRP